jgi:hypothetical protein
MKTAGVIALAIVGGLGAVFVLLGLWTGGWLITAYFRWARLPLVPTRSTGCAAETAGHWSVT